MFDLAFVGHFTKDTIVSRQGTSVQMGGAYYFGCHVAARMGLSTAVVTRLAADDLAPVHELEDLGVTVFRTLTPESTNLTLEYPTDDPDNRLLRVASSAGPFTVSEVTQLRARSAHIGASVRGEVPLEVVRALRPNAERISLDVQGFIRVNKGGQLVSESWPEMGAALALVDVLKTDIAEATFLTGSADRHRAASILAAFGPREVLVTHGGGLLVLANGTFHEAPWTAREIRGRSGRGDTCTAAYVGKRLSAGPAEATRFAAAVTGRKLEAPGPFRGDIAEIERSLAAPSGAPRPAAALGTNGVRQ